VPLLANALGPLWSAIGSLDQVDDLPNACLHVEDQAIPDRHALADVPSDCDLIGRGASLKTKGVRVGPLVGDYPGSRMDGLNGSLD